MIDTNIAVGIIGLLITSGLILYFFKILVDSTKQMG